MISRAGLRLFFHVHYHKHVFYQGANEYVECRCGDRDVKRCDYGYSAINYDWLAGRDFHSHRVALGGIGKDES